MWNCEKDESRLHPNPWEAISLNEPYVLIAAPVRDREFVLPHYLDHIDRLEYPKERISLLWVVNQSADRSEDRLREFQHRRRQHYRSIEIMRYFGHRRVPPDRRVTATRIRHTYSHLADVRNQIVDRLGDHDYLFSVDSDILVQPDSLSRLMEHRKDVVSSLIYNGYIVSPHEPWRYSNAIRIRQDGSLEPIANWYVKNAPNLTSKLCEVDVTGACCLIHRSVLEAGVRYRFDRQGEDIPWCKDAKSRGFSLWCDFGVYSRHIMEPSMLDGLPHTQ